MTVEYCPTGEMNGDFFTKLLQGASFRKFRDRVLNITEQNLSDNRVSFMDSDHSDDMSKDHRSVLRNNDQTSGGRTDGMNGDHQNHMAGEARGAKKMRVGSDRMKQR